MEPQASITGLLLDLVDGIHAATTLDVALQHVTACTSRLLGVERVSLRLLDESRTRLLSAARSGPPLHHDERGEFRIGEGLIGWIVANSCSLRLADAESDPRFARRADRIAPIGSFVGVPLIDAGGCIGVLSSAASTRGRFSETDEELVRLVAGIVAPHLQIGRLRRLANTDPLTSLLNRHALDEVLPDAGEAPASVAMIDIDHFKVINDTLGHAAGDDALRGVAEAISAVLRRDDRVIRIGGEEFLLVLPNATAEAARVVAERARSKIAECVLDGGTRITASAGVAQREPGERRHDLLVRVDAALYRAKALGRDRVILA